MFPIIPISLCVPSSSELLPVHLLNIQVQITVRSLPSPLIPSCGFSVHTCCGSSTSPLPLVFFLPRENRKWVSMVTKTAPGEAMAVTPGSHGSVNISVCVSSHHLSFCLSQLRCTFISTRHTLSFTQFTYQFTFFFKSPCNALWSPSLHSLSLELCSCPATL